ncbi:tripartite motif-containing protein 10-like [Colius striatus]|uniref:tripartite motif-containing protein 10-like n=1 Tax=Colius striatus TaxID=57412 RepID=UPI002B1D5604|nr:tripartite motif-containing protein 10-like [Colius striatus]
MARVTLDASTAHPRLLVSGDGLSARWEFSLQPPAAGPQRFQTDPCVLAHQSFASGRRWWLVDLSQGQFCAVGVSRESLPRRGSVGFCPEEGIWCFQTRALTRPPTLLSLPRVPRRIRVSLDYEWGEVGFFDVDNQTPIFTFPPASFRGERLRPWFWLELGSLSLPC